MWLARLGGLARHWLCGYSLLMLFVEQLSTKSALVIGWHYRYPIQTSLQALSPPLDPASAPSFCLGWKSQAKQSTVVGLRGICLAKNVILYPATYNIKMNRHGENQSHQKNERPKEASGSKTQGPNKIMRVKPSQPIYQEPTSIPSPQTIGAVARRTQGLQRASGEKVDWFQRLGYWICILYMFIHYIIYMYILYYYIITIVGIHLCLLQVKCFFCSKRLFSEGSAFWDFETLGWVRWCAQAAVS